MVAVEDWARRFDGAELPRASLPAVPKFNLAGGGLAQAAEGAGGLKNLQMNFLLDRDAMAREVGKSSSFEEQVLHAIDLNAGRIGHTIEFNR